MSAPLGTCPNSALEPWVCGCQTCIDARAMGRKAAATIDKLIDGALGPVDIKSKPLTAKDIADVAKQMNEYASQHDDADIYRGWLQTPFGMWPKRAEGKKLRWISPETQNATCSDHPGDYGLNCDACDSDRARARKEIAEANAK